MWIINKDNLHIIKKNLDFSLPLILGVFLSLANPPFSFPYIIVVVLVVIGNYWLKKNYSSKKSFFFGFLDFGYFTFSLVWIIEPFLVEPNLTVILAPFALIFLSAVLSFFWGCAFSFLVTKMILKIKKYPFSN